MGPFIEGYRGWLTTRGYSAGTVIHLLAMAGALGRWMNTREIAVGELNRAVIAEFRSARRASGMRCVPGGHGLDPLLEFLGQQGVVDVSARAGGPVEELVGRYRRWLVGERGLAEATVERYVKLARLFLAQRSAGSVPALENLTGTDIVAFLLRESERLSVGSVKGRVAELRSLLKFLYLQGLTPRPLATVVPPVAGWRDTGVPKAIPAADVALLLGGCDRHGPIGVRDFAILMLVARLGAAVGGGGASAVGGHRLACRADHSAGQGISPGSHAAAGRCRAGAGRLPEAGSSIDPNPERVPGRQGSDAAHPARLGRRRHPSGL